MTATRGTRLQRSDLPCQRSNGALDRPASNWAATRRWRKGCPALSNLLANAAPMGCTGWRSAFRGSCAFSCFVGRATARQCSTVGMSISTAPKSARTSAASASRALSATRAILPRVGEIPHLERVFVAAAGRGGMSAGEAYLMVKLPPRLTGLPMAVWITATEGSGPHDCPGRGQ